MPELTITIGDKDFTVACQPGEEQYLQAAAALLDREAQVLNSQIGRLPDVKMLLMAGLMLADRTAAQEEKVAEAEAKLARQEKFLAEVSMAKPTEALPEGLTEAMAILADEAEAAAKALEQKVSS